MTARTWKIVDMVWRNNPSEELVWEEWKATLQSGDFIIVSILIEGDVSKETAEEIVNQFVGKTAEDAAG